MKTVVTSENWQEEAEIKPCPETLDGESEVHEDADDDEKVVQIDTIDDIWEELIWDFEQEEKDADWGEFKRRVHDFEESFSIVRALGRVGEFTGRELLAELLVGIWGDDYTVLLNKAVTFTDFPGTLVTIKKHVLKAIQKTIAENADEFENWEYPSFTAMDIQERQQERARAIRLRRALSLSSETNAEPKTPASNSITKAAPKTFVVNYNPSLAGSTNLFDDCYKRGRSWCFPLYGKSLFTSPAYQKLPLVSQVLLFEMMDEANYQIKKHGAKDVMEKGFVFGHGNVRSQVAQTEFRKGLKGLLDSGFFGAYVSERGGKKTACYFPSDKWQTVEEDSTADRSVSNAGFGTPEQN